MSLINHLNGRDSLGLDTRFHVFPSLGPGCGPELSLVFLHKRTAGTPRPGPCSGLGDTKEREFVHLLTSPLQPGALTGHSATPQVSDLTQLNTPGASSPSECQPAF